MLRLSRCFCLLLLCWQTAQAEHFNDPMEDFQPSWLFERRVFSALETLEKLLDEKRNVQLAEHEDHTYEDKFALAEFLTGSTWRSLLDTFSRLGLPIEGTFEKMGKKGIDLSKERMFLYFDTARKCEFLEEKQVRVKGSKSIDTTVMGVKVGSTEEYHNVIEYHWNVTESYGMYACIGSCEDGGERVPMRGRSMSTKTKTTQDQEPVRMCTASQSMDLELTWFVRHIVTSGSQNFTINRNVESCRTPRRNKEIEAVFRHHKSLHDWFGSVAHSLEAIYTPKSEDEGSLASALGKPSNFGLLTFPFMENSTILPALDMEIMFNHEMVSVDQIVGGLSQIFPSASTNTMVSIEEASLYVYLARARAALVHYSQSMGYVEEMLRKQLIEALGKEVSPVDFDNYIRFHNRKFLSSEYAPQPFSYSIRPDEHQNPVGMISIETTGNHLSNNEPIQTMTRRISGGDDNPPIKIPLDASSFVQITGDRYLSGWLRHQFSSVDGTGPVSLIARARQFSSFMLMVGTMTSADTFDPKHAIILQNKDEVIIPLSANTLPSAKEFRDAIASLSPEQQEFATAFRAMQLESSVFAVCIVQLKPQMEKLLHLPPGSLAKEIQLTEDLMSLFVEYQIPSDIVSYDENNEAVSTVDKVEVVKGYVKAVIEVIETRKKQQFEDELQQSEARKAGQAASSASSDTRAKTRTSQGHVGRGGDYLSDVYSRRLSTATAQMVEEEFDSYAGPSSAPSISSAPSGGPSSARSSAHTKLYSSTPRMSASSSYESASVLKSPLLQEDVSENPKPESNEAQQRGESSETVSSEDESPESDDNSLDFTLLPRMLDKKLEKFDTHGHLKSTIIKPSQSWQLNRQANLLVKAKTHYLEASDIESERNKAMDMLDALSRSGTLAIESSELHVIIGATHCFEHSIMTTLVEDSINPIIKAELSTLLLGSTIYGQPVAGLLGREKDVFRLTPSMPALFGSASEQEEA